MGISAKLPADTAETEQTTDHYAEHLAEVNETQDVVSSVDIVNEQGVLLCKKGMRINKNTAERLVQHKLTQPIEDSIKLSNSISNSVLYKRLIDIQARYPDFNNIHNQTNFADICKNAFISTQLHPIVVQKLTVMNEQLNEQVDKAVFCAWLCTLIAAEMGLDRTQQESAFLAGLLHDIGFIHLSPTILNKQQALSAEEWRAIQSHVVIGKIMLEKYRDIPTDVARAVFEHHERCDGSGYPTSKIENNLSLLGQIVGIADSIYAIRTRQFEKHQRTIYDLLPYLQMNAHTHFYDVYKALSGILKRSGLQMKLPEKNDISQWSNTLLLRCHALGMAVDSMEHSCVLDLAQGLPGQKGKALFKISQHVLKMTAQSGLVKAEMQDWLQGIAKNPDRDALPELNEIDLMLNELHWQLNNAYKACNGSLEETNVSAETLFQIRETYNTVGLCLGDLEDKL